MKGKTYFKTERNLFHKICAPREEVICWCNFLLYNFTISVIFSTNFVLNNSFAVCLGKEKKKRKNDI